MPRTRAVLRQHDLQRVEIPARCSAPKSLPWAQPPHRHLRAAFGLIPAGGGSRAHQRAHHCRVRRQLQRRTPLRRKRDCRQRRLWHTGKPLPPP